MTWLMLLCLFLGPQSSRHDNKPAHHEHVFSDSDFIDLQAMARVDVDPAKSGHTYRSAPSAYP